MKLLGREISRKLGITLGVLAMFVLVGAGFGVYFLVSDGESEQPQVVPPATTTTTQRATTTTRVEPPPETPVIEPPHVTFDSPAVDVVAGRYHTCALHEDGTVSCWGSNEVGQIGAGLDTRDPNDPDASNIRTGGGGTPVPTPAKVKELDESRELVDLTGITAISSGSHHTCALHTNETVSCWGRNNVGQLGHRGDCTNSERDSFGGLPLGPCDDTGNRAVGTCSVERPPISFDLQIRYASEENCAAKVLDASDNELGAVQISLYGEHSCALHADGTVSCWGFPIAFPSNEILEFNYTRVSPIPVTMPDINDIVSISTGDRHACGIHRDTTVSCWGVGTGGRLGDRVVDTFLNNGRRNERVVPLPVKVMRQYANGSSSALDQVKSVHAGRLQTCAIHFDGTASCWGYRDVTIESARGRIIPEQDRFAAEQIFVTDPAGDSISSFQDIAFNDFDECRIAQQGSIFCSGENSDRGLGEWSTETDRGNFYDAREIQKIAVGGEHTCIIYDTKSLLSCWGSNEDGQLGTGAS